MQIGRLLTLQLSAVGLILKAMSLGSLKQMKPPVAVRQYQGVRPGEMIHVAMKQLPLFDRVDHRITGDRRLSH
jgi:hypothetical protein